jgi:hypothetical protein
MMVLFVMLGSFLSLASASVPSAHAASTMSFYSSPQFGTISVDGTVQKDGWVGTYAIGERIHVVAIDPTGSYEFAGWIVHGASVDSLRSQNTYVTITDDQGSLTAVWVKVHDAGHESSGGNGSGPGGSDGGQGDTGPD